MGGAGGEGQDAQRYWHERPASKVAEVATEVATELPLPGPAPGPAPAWGSLLLARVLPPASGPLYVLLGNILPAASPQQRSPLRASFSFSSEMKKKDQRGPPIPSGPSAA